MEIKIGQDLFDNEARLAEINRGLYDRRGLVVVNLLAGPGAGKTSLIKQTAPLLKCQVAVIEGDPASRIDTDLLNSLGIPAYQINTEGGCHLEPAMIASALEEFAPPAQSLVFIENVGNLICTAGYPLGEHLRVVMLGVSEGDDKPYKYPDIFQEADAIILNKTDLKPLVDFKMEFFRKGVQALNQKAPIFEVSCRSQEGLELWANWLETAVEAINLSGRGY